MGIVVRTVDFQYSDMMEEFGEMRNDFVSTVPSGLVSLAVRARSAQECKVSGCQCRGIRKTSAGWKQESNYRITDHVSD